MYGLRAGAVLAMGLTLSACDGTLAGLSSTSAQEVYASPGYYGSPSAYGPYAEPGYVAPYTYQPGYGGSYGYGPGWGGGWGGWREHEGRERRERAFHNDDRPFSQPPQGPGNVPHMAAQPRNLAPAAPPPMAAQPPPAATPQVQQNRKLLDQLGFRPSR
jgi:hypothetical protein